MGKKELEFTVNESWQRAIKDQPWLSCILEESKDTKEHYIRKVGSNIIYKKVGEDYECTGCKTKAKVVSVSHPVVWNQNQPFKFKKYYQERLIYCPKCEKQPNLNGDPVIL